MLLELEEYVLSKAMMAKVGSGVRWNCPKEIGTEASSGILKDGEASHWIIRDSK